MPALGPYKPPLFNRLSRNAMRPLFRGLFHLLAHVELHGFENIPIGKPYVTVFNHVSSFDPPFLLAFWPEGIEALGASDIWNRAGFGQNLLVRLFGGIPVRRGEYDRQALDRVTRILTSGYPLLLSPEGGRTRAPGMRRAHPGLAHIIAETGVLVLPVGIVGATSDFFVRAIRAQRPTLSLTVGVPLSLPPLAEKGEARRKSRQRNVDMVMRQVAQLLPEEYRGVYA